MSCWMHITGVIEVAETRNWKYRIEDKIPPKEFFENIKYDILKALGGISETDFYLYRWYRQENNRMENYWSNPEPNLLFELGKFAYKHPDLIREHNDKLDGSEGGIYHKIIPVRPASHLYNIRILVDGSLRDRGETELDVIDFFKIYTNNLFKLDDLDKIWISNVNILIYGNDTKYIIQREYTEDDGEIFTLRDIYNCKEVAVNKRK